MKNQNTKSVKKYRVINEKTGFVHSENHANFLEAGRALRELRTNELLTVVVYFDGGAK